MKSILFTSAVPGEGKSTIVANLGLAMGKTGQKVIIVDCDMRIPTQHKIFGVPNKLGLNSLLNQQASLIDVVQKTHNPNTWLLTSGPIASNPIELLGSPQMKSLLDVLTQKFTYVLLDTPALLPVGDAIMLSSQVDAITLITRQIYTKEEAFQEACKILTDLNTKTIGVVVNDAKQNGTYYYYKRKNS
jgi:capsular exopolysaccharide synthesis family protein